MFQSIFVFHDLCVIGLGLDAFMHALRMIGYYIAIIHTHLEQNTFNTSPINNAYYGASTTPCTHAMPYAPHDLVATYTNFIHTFLLCSVELRASTATSPLETKYLDLLPHFPGKCTAHSGGVFLYGIEC